MIIQLNTCDDSFSNEYSSDGRKDYEGGNNTPERDEEIESYEESHK